MRLTPARRAAISFALALLLGWAPILWGTHTAVNVFRFLLRGYARCTETWRDFGNYGCTELGPNHSFVVPLAIVELLACLALLVCAGWLLARWTLAPLRAMTQTVDRLGPASLGLRLAETGPHDAARRLSDSIDRLLDRLAEGYEAQRRFAATASHELRTPLATQRTLIEVSLDGSLTPEQLQLLSRQLLATNERNERLIEGLLVLAETERGLVSRGPQRLDEIAGEVAELLRPAADEAGVEMRTSLGEAVVLGERPLIERLVQNLVLNGIRHNEPGGWVSLEVKAPGTLMVGNSGPPVPSEAVPTLFEPFRRLSGERLDHGGGAGLGLAIVRSIAAAHEASVSAKANPGGGLTIAVRLPGEAP